MKSYLLVGIFILFSSNSDAAKVEASKFIIEPKILSVEISPDGKYLAILENKESSQVLRIKNLTDRSERVLIDFTDFSKNESKVSGVSWIDNKSVAAQFSEIKTGVDVLLDTRRVEYMIVIEVPIDSKTKAKVKSVRTSGWLISGLSHISDEFYYAKSGPQSKIYRIKASGLGEHKKRLGKLSKKDGGQFKKDNEVVSIDGFATRWFTDDSGEPRAVLSFNFNGELVLSSINAEGEIVQIKSWSNKDKDKDKGEKEKFLLPIAYISEKKFYAIDFNSEERRDIFEIDLENNSETILYTSESYKIIDLILTQPGSHLVGVKVLKEGKVINQFIDTNLDSHSQKKPITLSADISWNLEKSKGIQYLESFNRAGEFQLINAQRQKLLDIGTVFSYEESEFSGIQHEDSVEVEGLEIPYIVNIPKSATNKNIPLVVYPHGGPIGIFDEYYFDQSTQYLVANGFAVLRVNFRGSGGFSKTFEEAGKKEWGNLILEDIYRSTLKVLNDPRISNSKVCILGMSYGGYAAASLSLKYPETYKCGISISGVMDMNLYVASPYTTDSQFDWLKEYVGDAVSENDRLKNISPIYSARKLKTPFLIMHGAKDRVVDIEHFHRMKLMLEKYNKKFEFHVFPESGHHMEYENDKQIMFQKLADFLSAHLN